MMQINITANSYIQFYVSVSASPITETRGHSKFEKHAGKSMTIILAGNLSYYFCWYNATNDSSQQSILPYLNLPQVILYQFSDS